MKNKTKRILWLVLTILFTLTLLADAAIGFFLPERSSFGPMGNMPDFSEMSESGEMPDFSSMPQFSENGERPDFSQTTGDGEMPDFSQMSAMPQMGNQGGMGILYKIKTYAIPIGIGCLLCALLCLWRFLALKPRVEESAEATPKTEEEDEKPRKSGMWKTVVALVLCAAVLIAMFGGKGNSDTSNVEVITENRSSEVTVGSLDEALLSGGSLSESESESVSYAGDVRVLDWEVGENEVVVKGQVLATVDKNSVLSSISELKELMDDLDSALESSRSDKLSTTLTAPLAGRIVAVFAETGDSVPEVVAEHGALMLLSLDGKLSLDIDAGELAVGDALSIRRADGTVLEAQVSELMEGVATVTVSDALTSYGESVTVLNAALEELGSGELGVHRSMGITLFGGTVSAVYGKVGASVYKGQTLITLSGTEYTGEYESLLARRAKLENQINALYALYDAGAIVASETGYVSNLNNSAVGIEEADETQYGSGMGFPFGLSATGSTGKVTLLSAFRSNSASVTLLADPPAGDIPTGGPTGDTPEGEVETYTLIGTVSAINTDAGSLTLQLFDGGTLEVSLADLITKCQVSTLNMGSLLVLSYSTEDDVLQSCSVYTPATGGGSGAGGGGGMSFSYIGTTTTTTEPDYIADETVLCTLTVFNKVDISLSVDELDIRALSVGQEVEVTLDALEAQVFTGTITEIDPNGENSGGNTKYTVTVTMDRTENMLSGMNASVRIPLQKHESLLLLPCEAIQEDESGVYVYTSYSEKEESYGGRVDITTGFSDGSMVEIRSGLSEGDTVCYSYADTLQYTFTNK